MYYALVHTTVKPSARAARRQPCAADAMPRSALSCTAALNGGVSSMLRRMYRPVGPSMLPNKNDKRQPHASRAAGVSQVLSEAEVSEPSKNPHATLACCKLPNRPRRCGGAHSTMKAVELPHSPPAEKPCSKRAATSNAEAPTPIDS